MSTSLGGGHLQALADLLGAGGLRHADVQETLDPGFHIENLGAGVVAFPRSTEEVQALVRYCVEHRIEIVPHGGRSGLAGGAYSKPGQLIVQMTRMNRILSLDRHGATAVVEAGVTLQQLQEACEPCSLSVGIDLAARGSATIGGMTSTNAGGIEAFRHGVMRHRVLGMEAVLANTRVLDDLKRVTKANEGYDIKQLLIGAEGTLGIITKVALNLVPAAGPPDTALVSCRDAAEAVRLLHRLRRTYGDRLQAAEIMWPDYAHTTARALDCESVLRFVPDKRHVLVLLDMTGDGEDGSQSVVEQALAEAIDDDQLSGAIIAKNEKERRGLWAIREESFLCDRDHPHGFWFDVSVPVNELQRYTETLFERVVAVGRDFLVFLFGHLGDGNLHLTVTCGREVPELEAAITEAVFTGLKECGGSFSAEHGIGLEKRSSLAKYTDRTKVETMREIKRLLDPNGIMNPGKVL